MFDSNENGRESLHVNDFAMIMDRYSYWQEYDKPTLD